MRAISEYQNNICKCIKLSNEKENALCDFNMTLLWFSCPGQTVKIIIMINFIYIQKRQNSIINSHVYITNFANYQLMENLVYSYLFSCIPYYSILLYHIIPFINILVCIFKDNHNIIISLEISNNLLISDISSGFILN